jgi:protein-S-isoprenylcysteine O-methyltransferase Ste14
MDRKRWPRVLPPVYLLGAIALMLALDYGVPGGRLVRAPWTYLGAVPITIGCGIVLACARTFQRRETTIKPFEVSNALVTDGLYHYSRNPIYLAMLFILVGVAIGLGSISPWLVPPIFAWMIQARFIKAEEAMLATKFGDEFERYCQRTRRWI